MNYSLRIAENAACCYRAISGNGIRLIWEITGRCNLHCIHCFAAVSPVNSTVEKELTTEQALNIIEQFDFVNVAKVMLTGGEVFVRDDIEYIIDAIKKKRQDIVVDITTNAILLDDARIGRLKKMGVNELSVSFDGPKDVYQSIRGTNVDYEHLIYNIQQLLLSGICVDGIMVLNKLTMGKLEKTINDAAGLGLSSLTIANLVKLPHSVFSYEQLSLSNEDINKCMRRIEELKNEYSDKLVLRSVGFVNCPGADRCQESKIIAIDRNGMYCHCLNDYAEDDLRLDSRIETLQSSFEKINNFIAGKRKGK